MLDMIKIQDAINRLLVKIYPDFAVYIDDVPQGFERPSFLIEYISSSTDIVNKNIVFEKVYYTVTYFGPVDDYYNQDTLDLQKVLINILKPFRQGYIQVEDRAIAVKASNGGKNKNEIYMDIQVEYFEDRLEVGPSYPLMEDININLKEIY